MQESNENLLAYTSGSLEYEVTGSERILNVILKKMEDMENKIHDLETKKILDETHLPKELLEENDLLPHKPLKLKPGKGYRPLMRSEIEEAKKISPFAAQQAKWMGVSTTTYKKYSQLYGIWEPKPNEKGKRNLFDPNRGKFHLKDILDNKYPDIGDWTAKDKLIRSGMLPPKCNVCGYDKRRITDKKICLLLDHIDGNRKNFKFENLQLLCLNCTFECGRGYIRRGNHMFDADWIQGAELEHIDKRSRW